MREDHSLYVGTFSWKGREQYRTGSSRAKFEGRALLLFFKDRTDGEEKHKL